MILKVFLAKSKTDKHSYAIKAIKKEAILRDDDIDCSFLERDVLAMASKNPYLTQLFCSFHDHDYLYMVMEFVGGGDLMYHVIKCNGFNEKSVKFYACEIICGLRFLHKNGIVYRDLKLDNTLLDSHGHIKLADFGMCKRLGIDGTTGTFCGTPDYIAPEVKF